MHATPRLILIALALAAGACGGHAATVTATPETLQALLDRARGGDTITVAAGDYAPILLRSKTWSPPVTVEAAAGRFAGIEGRRISGLTWRGGTFDGKREQRNGFKIEVGDHIVVENTTMTGFLRNGIGFGNVSDARIAGNTFSDGGSDGIDVALSRRVVIDGNQCRNGQPTPGAHPDCIQLWSRPTAPPVADITITNNTAYGDMQGIGLFNHVREGVDDGGFDRIRIENNDIKVKQWHGIAVSSCRDCIVRNNRVEALPNGRIKAWIKFKDVARLEACGNVQTAWPAGDEAKRCRNS